MTWIENGEGQLAKRKVRNLLEGIGFIFIKRFLIDSIESQAKAYKKNQEDNPILGYNLFHGRSFPLRSVVINF